MLVNLLPPLALHMVQGLPIIDVKAQDYHVRRQEGIALVGSRVVELEAIWTVVYPDVVDEGLVEVAEKTQGR